MRTRTTICDQPFVSRFLSGELSETEAQDFEAHLALCEQCQQQLKEQTASADEWDQLKESLRQSGDGDFTGIPRIPTEELESIRRLLGPTDDPRMMGRIGTYEVTGLLGRGGMGIVFKALDPALNRYVAIKMLAPMFLAGGSSKQRFIREAQSAAAVVHEHVVGIHGISEWQGFPYLVMTYVRGESLQTRLASRGQLSLREVLRIGMQISSGLAAAHAQGLIHRDIKPANILLESDVDRVVITDFGLARAIDDLRMTGTNTLLGTPEYMSPEQARDEVLDFRTDLFSLGCVLYEASTGKSPFRSSTSYGALRKVTEQNPPSVRSLVSDLPDWFAKVIDRLLKKDSETRFASAGEVATILQQCLAYVEQPHLTPLPKSLLQPQTQWFSSPFTRRIAMNAPWILTVLVGSWALFAQFGQVEPETNQTKVASEKPDAIPEKTTETQPAGKPAQLVATAGKYILRVRKADAIDQMRLGIKPAKPEAMFKDVLNGKGQQQKSSNQFQKSEQSSGGSSFSSGRVSTSSSFSSGGGVSTGGGAVRPNLAVAFDVEVQDRVKSNARENAIFELENLTATDEDGKPVAWTGDSPFNFYDPEFEKNGRDALIAYFQEEYAIDKLKSVTGNLKVTPGRVYEVEFPDGKPATKKSGEHSFTLKNLQSSDQGIQVSLVLPQLSKPRGNVFGNPDAMLKAMLERQGAVEVMLEDSEGVIHHPNGSGSGSASGSSSAGGFSSGGGSAGGSSGGTGSSKSGFSQNSSNSGNSTAHNESNFLFAGLPDGRKIKSIIVRANDKTGKPQSYPFKIDSIPIPYASE